MHSLHLLPLALLLIFFGGSCAQTVPSAPRAAATATPDARTNVGTLARPADAAISNAARARHAAPASVSVETLQQLLRLWIADEPEAALTFIHQLPHADLRARLLPEAMRQWASCDIVSASDWTMRLGRSAGEKNFLLSEAICGLAAVDPAEALLWFAVMSPDVRDRFDGSEQLDWENYFARMPADAAARIPLLPAGSLKTRLATAFTRTLAATDRVAAEWWAEEIADTAARNAALAALRHG